MQRLVVEIPDELEEQLEKKIFDLSTIESKLSRKEVVTELLYKWIKGETRIPREG